MADWTALGPVLIGVAAGAVASLGTTILIEWFGWRRRHGARWDEVRLHAYSDYAGPIAETMTLCSRIASARGLDTRPSARRWHQAVWLLVWYVRGLKDDADGWDLAYRDAVSKRDGFYEHARRDLSIARGVLPSQPPWPLPWMTETTASAPA